MQKKILVADFLASEGFQCGSETLMQEPNTKESEEGSMGTKTIAGRKTISESLNVHLTLENMQHWVGVAGTLALWLQSLVGPISQERESTNCIEISLFNPSFPHGKIVLSSFSWQLPDE